MPLNPWGGPPTSGNSPLRENIPESPTDGFPDFAQLPAPGQAQTRRARAGTLPSRLSPGGPGNGILGLPPLMPLVSKTSRPSPSQTPFHSPSPALDPPDPSSNAAMMSRLRAGSMPHRSFAPGPGTSSPFGTNIFGGIGGWNLAPGRERGNTLASIASVGSNGPSSPAQSHFSREGLAEGDSHFRTLDYLGLAEPTPQPTRAQLATPIMHSQSDMASRFRSYSVNHKDTYHDEDDDDYGTDPRLQYASMQKLKEEIALTEAAIRNHNAAVQAVNAYTASAARPRARTAGVLDMPSLSNKFLPTPSRMGNSITAAEIRMPEDQDFDDLPQAVAGMSLGAPNGRNNLGVDEQGSEGPTSALWLGGIPTSTTTSTLTEYFKSFGPIKSVRVLTHKNCGFVNFERTDSAIAARNSVNGHELFPGGGPVRINFAKPPSGVNTPGHDGAYPSPSPDPFAHSQDNVHNGSSANGAPAASTATAVSAETPTVRPLHEMTADIMQIVTEFGAVGSEVDRTLQNLQNAIQFTEFREEIPQIKEPAHNRVHDAPKLRDIRKRIDNQMYTKPEIEAIATDMLPEIAELASDYLGNTVVQKLFEHCSVPIRDAMLSKIAPHLAEIGTHKNGTWAAQKIIDVCRTPQQMSLIEQNLRPYTVQLFLDQFGNYVLQGCLKFEAPYNDFIFETMLSKMWEIAQGRYGSRAMRACLESHHTNKEQQRMLAAAIALHSVQLASNANGALLLTWLLDTCNFPRRRTVLAPQLIPHLVHLCTHKVAYLTVLKVINQKAEPEARDSILEALFFGNHNQVLEAILRDHACGVTLIFKVLTTPFFDESIRSQVVDNVKNVLIHIKALPGQGYKRLMDEVGLSTRGGSSGPSGNGGNGGGRDHSTNGGERQRPMSRQASLNAPHQQQQHQGQHASQQQQPGQYNNAGGAYYNPLNAGGNQANYEINFGVPRGEGIDSGPPQPFPAFPSGAMFGGPGNPMNPAALQQFQFQQSMMARGAPPPMGNFYPPMPAGFGGYQGSTPPYEQYRSQNSGNGSPVQGPGAHPAMPPSQAQFAPPGFGMMPGYGYGGIQNMGYMQEQPANNNTRRGRVGRSPQPDGRRHQ